MRESMLKRTVNSCTRSSSKIRKTHSGVAFPDAVGGCLFHNDLYDFQPRFFREVQFAPEHNKKRFDRKGCESTMYDEK